MIPSMGLEIKAKSEKLPLLSNFIGNSMLKFGLSEYQQFQVQIAVDEAVKNIIKYGNLEKSDKVSIKCEKQDNEINIVIKYPGEPFNPSIIKNDLNYSSLKQNNDYLKVYFINKNMNKVNYEFLDEMNLLTLTKCI